MSADPTATPGTRRQRDDIFRLLVASVEDYAIFLLDPGGLVLTWNTGAQRIKGYTADEIIGKHFSIFYPPQDVRYGKPDYGLRVAFEEGRWGEEGWRIRKDGSAFWASVVITALRDTSGELVGFAKVTRDLTERKQAEEERITLLALEREARAEMQEAFTRLQAIQSVTEAALAHLTLGDLLGALLDRISEILIVDTVAVLLLDESGENLIPRAAKGIEGEVADGIPIPIGSGFAGRIAAERRAIVLDEVGQADLLNPMLREKGVRSLLGVPLLVEGRVVGVLRVGALHSRNFTDRDVSLLQVAADRVALAIDHARLYEAAQQARRAAVEATDAIQLRDRFLSVAAHELKTPVTSVRGYAQLLLRDLDRGKEMDSARHRSAIETIHRQSEKLSRLISQLLETSRFDAGLLALERRVTDLSALVAQVVDEIKSQSHRHAIVLSATPPVYASVDALRLEQVVLNLLDNAIKYSPEGGEIDLAVTQPTPGWVQLVVRDHGIGIPPDQREEIFERYYQAHASSHRSGLGLGLYLTRQIVEQHGGRIWVEAPEGGGSRFVVAIPGMDETAREGEHS